MNYSGTYTKEVEETVKVSFEAITEPIYLKIYDDECWAVEPVFRLDNPEVVFSYRLVLVGYEKPYAHDRTYNNMSLQTANLWLTDLVAIAMDGKQRFNFIAKLLLDYSTTVSWYGQKYITTKEEFERMYRQYSNRILNWI